MVARRRWKVRLRRPLGTTVQNNPYRYRAGMRFPPFWKMFLLAVEDGRSTKQLP